MTGTWGDLASIAGSAGSRSLLFALSDHLRHWTVTHSAPCLTVVQSSASLHTFTARSTRRPGSFSWDPPPPSNLVGVDASRRFRLRRHVRLAACIRARSWVRGAASHVHPPAATARAAPRRPAFHDDRHVSRTNPPVTVCVQHPKRHVLHATPRPARTTVHDDALLPARHSP